MYIHTMYTGQLTVLFSLGKSLRKLCKEMHASHFIVHMEDYEKGTK